MVNFRLNLKHCSVLHFNPLKPKERERERGRRESGGGGGSDRYYILAGGPKFRFAATKVPRQCPLVLLVKVGLVKVRRLEVKR
jgi:hypothetical protein